MSLVAQSLSLTDISVDYGRGAVVENFNVHVEPGKILALLGQSGCGKSTVLRVIAGLLTPSAGSVCFGSNDVTFQPPWERNLGLMFQSHALFPHLTVLRNVQYGLRPRRLSKKESEQRAFEMLDLVQMSKYANVYPTELSGGQSQRVALARAFVRNARLVVLDEPTAHLDPVTADSVEAAIAELVAGRTALIISHRDELALLADRIVEVRDGGR